MAGGTRRFWWSAGAIVLACVLAGLLIRFGDPRGPTPGRRVVLDVNLGALYPEAPVQSSLGRLLAPRRLTLAELTTTLDRAAQDDSVAGIVAQVGSPSGMARAQELRDAIARFRSGKKFALAFTDTFGEAGNASVAYYLASAFDEIWMQPSGDLWLAGVVLEAPFIRGTLDKLAIEPVFGQRYEYKNAMNFFTERKFTAAHREAMEKLKDSWFGQIVRGIAQGRHISNESVRAAVDHAPLLGREAVETKLIDGLAYRDEVAQKALARAGGAELLPLARYRSRLGEPGGKHAFALVYGVGEVIRGRSESNPLLDTDIMGAETVGAALRAAAADSGIEAIVFRVDSPGGSYVASDTIWREVSNARRAGKPVVVSMGNLAGSGGYFVALSADKIVAQPGTITGSIGVLAGKFVLSGLFDKLGLSFDEVHAGEHALFWDPNRAFSIAERERFEAYLDRIYDDFTQKVAQGRRLPRERVLEIARGRIWSGEDAKGLGLIDELGGLETAVRLARQEAKIPASESIRLVPFPRPKSFFEALRGLFFREGEEETIADARAELLRSVTGAFAPIVRRLAALGLQEPSGVLSMPPLTAR
jgi:protease IV